MYHGQPTPLLSRDPEFEDNGRELLAPVYGGFTEGFDALVHRVSPPYRLSA